MYKCEVCGLNSFPHEKLVKIVVATYRKGDARMVWTESGGVAAVYRDGVGGYIVRPVERRFEPNGEFQGPNIRREINAHPRCAEIRASSPAGKIDTRTLEVTRKTRLFIQGLSDEDVERALTSKRLGGMDLDS